VRSSISLRLALCVCLVLLAVLEGTDDSEVSLVLEGCLSDSTEREDMVASMKIFNNNN